MSRTVESQPQPRSAGRGGRRAAAWALFAVAGGVLLGAACDDAVEPPPPPGGNSSPETVLLVQSGAVRPQFYKIQLRWYGSDADGRVVRYRTRWTPVCPSEPCPVPPEWSETTALEASFVLPVPGDSARFAFEVAAVDDRGGIDPTPARQAFTFYNNRPVVAFQAGSRPTRTLPAVTYYLTAADPDTTANPNDRDSRAHLSHFLVWLDGAEAGARVVPVAGNSVTIRPEDFAGRYGSRTVFIQVFDDGGAGSLAIQHTWTVDEPPAAGILLVDDCRMGGFLESRSDASYRSVLGAAAPGRHVVLDIETLPRLSAADLEANLSLFDRVVWYTDADTTSSGALQLARAGLEALLARRGRLFLSSGLVFGTRSAFGDREAVFRQHFGIDSVFVGPNRSTNFAIDLADTVHAAVHPGLQRFRFLSFGLRAIMECFASRRDADTRSVYFYPESTFVRDTFRNPAQFDIGVVRTPSAGPSTVYVSFPIGLPINDNVGENEIEIRELLRLAGILDP